MDSAFLKAVISTDKGLVDLKNSDIDHDTLYKEYLLDTQLDPRTIKQMSLDKVRLIEKENRLEYICENYVLIDKDGIQSKIDDELSIEIDEVLKKRIMSYAYGSMSDREQDYPYRQTTTSLKRGFILVRSVMLTFTYEAIAEMNIDMLVEVVRGNFAIDGLSDGVFLLNDDEVSEIVNLILDRESYDVLFQGMLSI